MGDLPAFGEFLQGRRQSPLQRGLVVAPTAQASLEHLDRRRLEQHQERLVAKALEDLTGALEFDVEHEMPGVVGIRYGRAVQVAVVLGPLEEPGVGDALLEGGAVDERVGVGAFTWTRRARRPGPREDEPIVLGAEQFGDRVLPDPAGSGDDDDQGFEPSSRSSSFAF